MSIKKVANIAGVSIATVSRFFNSPNKVSQTTREKVAEAIEQINYSPNMLAQNLRRGKTGLIIAVVDKLSSPFHSSIIDHMSNYAASKGYTLLSQQNNKSVSLSLEDYGQMVRSKQADGFIFLTDFPEQSLNTDIEHKPAFVLACEAPEKKRNSDRVSVGIDDFKAAYEATEYLIHQGHKKIAFIQCDSQSARAIKQRRLGYIAATRMNNVALAQATVDGLDQCTDLQEKLDYLYYQADRPTALLCADDDLAIETLHYLKKQSLRVPEDVSVIGFNNSPYSALTDPPLTTIEAPVQDIATRAFDSLLSLMAERQYELKHTVLEHAFIERESTSPPNH